MEKHFDTVIVGSGFGGSVMAARLAEAGKAVCVLERGKAYAPGDFPRSPGEMSKAFWDPSQSLYGMFNAWSFQEFGAVVSSGLGGGSLIYANVMLRKPEKTFVEELDDGYREWPVTRADLDSHYDQVEKILGANTLPYDVMTHALTSKGRGLIEAAKGINREWKPAPLAITFGAADAPLGQPIPLDPHNVHGRARLTCRMCGECDIGCNYGSKNTLDHTYLSIANKNKATIQTLCEVKSFRRLANDGYEVQFVRHDPDSDSKNSPVETITCDRLVLSAGALGTPYLMLKNQAGLGAPGLPSLGSRFCTNGDLLSIIAKSKRTNADGKAISRKLDPSRGPVITGYIDIDGGSDQTRGYYIEDAGIPDILTWLVQAVDSFGRLDRAIHLAKQVARNLLGFDHNRDLSGAISDFFGDCELSMSSLPLLGMGRDEPNGKMALETDKHGKECLQVDWESKRSGEFFKRLRGSMEELAQQLDGNYVDDPIWSFNHRVITVHPLGGCPMGTNAENGVVDSYGKVFGAGNLYIADGSVMPGPVGPNPSLTIAALANRFAEKIIRP